MGKIIYMPKPIEIKACNKKELMNLFNVTEYVINKMLKNTPGLGKPNGGQYSVVQLLLLIETYGLPGQVMMEAA